MTDIVGMGALNEDIIFTIKDGKEEELIKKIRKENRQHIVTYNDYKDYLNLQQRVGGGSAANTVITLAVRDWKCSFIGELGNDETAAFVEKQLNKHGIKTLIKKVDGKTGSCGIVLHIDGKYSVLFKEGVSDDIEIGDDILNEVRSCRIFHSSPFSSFKSLNSLKTQVALAAEAKNSGVVVSVSPGRLYTETFSNDDKPEKRRLVEKLLSNSDIVFINKNEGHMVSGEEDYEKASEKIMKTFGIKVICMTLGSNGCHVRTADEKISIDAINTKPVATLGAGDAFTAGFLDSYLRGRDIIECARKGNEFAGLRIKHIDPKDYLSRIKVQ
ncbi:MAG: carbohydrate kinase family protein [Candidatus Aenigmarchaeota archaeon]|nr:carbohydrate kinase family protein [Candidatus Aenigmarchaeota archaeon]